MPQFEDISHWSNRYDETDYYYFRGNTYLPNGYDFNALICDFLPSLDEFVILEDIFLDYAYELNLSYYSFIFPQDHPLSQDLITYFEGKSYGIAINQLLVLNPSQFITKSKVSVTCEIKPITTNDEVAQYLTFNEKIYSEIDPDFVSQKHFHFLHHLEDPHTIPLGAFVNGQLVGYLTLLSSPQYLEIDDFSVANDWQRKGIGQTLQKWVVQKANKEKKHVILVADADDTPLNMYLKQGYQACGFQISCNKKIPTAIQKDIANYQNGAPPQF